MFPDMHTFRFILVFCSDIAHVLQHFKGRGRPNVLKDITAFVSSHLLLNGNRAFLSISKSLIGERQGQSLLGHLIEYIYTHNVIRALLSDTLTIVT